MNNTMNHHSFGGIDEDADLLTQECVDCGLTVAGDKPSDLWDADLWAGDCPKAIEAFEAHLLSEPETLTYNLGEVTQ